MKHDWCRSGYLSSTSAGDRAVICPIRCRRNLLYNGGTPTAKLPGRFAMSSAVKSGMAFLAGMLMAGLATAACAQQPQQYPKPTDLPNPYRLAEDWPTLPPNMNGGRW